MQATRMTVAAAILLFAVAANAGLDPRLEELAPYLDKTFEGTFTDLTTGKEAVDVQHWEAMLGGKAIRVTHSLNGGEYGGESIIFWDGKLESVAYYYFTTAGFYTHGTLALDQDVFTAHEFVEGDTDGITEVRSVSKVLEDGRIHLNSEFLKNGEWVPAHEIFYAENPAAKVIFK